MTHKKPIVKGCHKMSRLQNPAAGSTFSSRAYLEGLMAELDRAAISQRLQQSRQRAGVTQEEMADILRVHVNSIQNYESVKQHSVPFDRLDEWAQITGVTKAWLLQGEEPTPPADLEELRRQLADVQQRLADMHTDVLRLLGRDDPSEHSGG